MARRRRGHHRKLHRRYGHAKKEVPIEVLEARYLVNLVKRRGGTV